MKNYITESKKIYERCVQFHGHSCPGLAIGVRAALEAQRILGLTFAKDEEIVCITENDACGVDGIQVVLGCSAGKGNLIFRIRGKQAFSIYNRQTGESVRLAAKEIADEAIAKQYPGEDHKEAKIRYWLEAELEDVFGVSEAKYPLPEEAKFLESCACQACGEMTAEPYLRVEQGKVCCLDCVSPYRSESSF